MLTIIFSPTVPIYYVIPSIVPLGKKGKFQLDSKPVMLLHSPFLFPSFFTREEKKGCRTKQDPIGIHQKETYLCEEIAFTLNLWIYKCEMISYLQVKL